MLRCVPGPAVLVVLCGEADTPALAVCMPGGLCDRAYFVRACVLGGLPDMRMYEMGRASAHVRESGPWFAGTSAVHYTSGLVYRAVAQGPVCQTALGLV